MIPNILFERKKKKELSTVSAYPGTVHFEERTFKKGGKEHRSWDFRRSKLGAAIIKGVKETGLKQGSSVLYLGASHGFTPSYVSDIVAKHGVVFCLDFAPRVVRDLVFICEQRDNMIPLLEDANHPESFADKVHEVDVVYQDIAQRNQVEIFVKNCELYLKKGGFGLLALKAKSVDVTKKPKDIYKETEKQLKKKLTIVEKTVLDPFEKDHMFFVVRK